MAAVPQCKADVTEKWLQEVLIQALNPSGSKTVRVNVKSLDLIKEFIGFVAVNFTAKVSLIVDDNKTKDLDLFIKIGPEIDKSNPIHPFVKEFELEAGEVRTYNEILPAMVAFEKKHVGLSLIEEMVPKVYAAEVDKGNGSYIVMENLASSGHFMMTDKEKITKDHMSLIVKKTGQLHAVGFAYGQNHGLDDIQKCVWPSYISSSSPMLVDGIEQFIEDIVESMDLAPELVQHLKSLTADPYKKTAEVFGDNHNFLIHGDLWNNNVMFCDNVKSGLSCKLLDFQQFGRGNPCFDFARVVHHSPVSSETMESRLPGLFDNYYSSFVETLATFTFNPPFLKEDFIKDVESKGVFMCAICDMLVYKSVRLDWPLEWRQKIKYFFEKALKNDPTLFQL